MSRYSTGINSRGKRIVKPPPAGAAAAAQNAKSVATLILYSSRAISLAPDSGTPTAGTPDGKICLRERSYDPGSATRSTRLLPTIRHSPSAEMQAMVSGRRHQRDRYGRRFNRPRRGKKGHLPQFEQLSSRNWPALVDPTAVCFLFDTALCWFSGPGTSANTGPVPPESKKRA